jgi:hypothetical protein
MLCLVRLGRNSSLSSRHFELRIFSFDKHTYIPIGLRQKIAVPLKEFHPNMQVRSQHQYENMHMCIFSYAHVHQFSYAHVHMAFAQSPFARLLPALGLEQSFSSLKLTRLLVLIKLASSKHESD